MSTSRCALRDSAGHQRQAIAGDTALRPARYFDTTPEVRLNMQRDHELERVAEALGGWLKAEVKRRPA